MDRLLTTDKKRSIKETQDRNPVYQTINAAYKKREIEMKTFHFAPEEIWNCCFIYFDRILKGKDELDKITAGLWDEIYCDLRDETIELKREYDDDNRELDTATSCILYSVIACMIATDDYTCTSQTETLLMQVAEHSDLDLITIDFDRNIKSDFPEYIKAYVQKGRFISDNLQKSVSNPDPVKPVIKPKAREKAIEDAKRRLAFMSSVLKPHDETLIMSKTDYNTMLEAVEYLIRNNSVKKQTQKLVTHMPITHLRYTFYLVWKCDAKFIKRDLWLTFLTETFSQMKDNAPSLSQHFSDKPENYDYDKSRKGK